MDTSLWIHLYIEMAMWIPIYLLLLSRSFSDHHLRCGGLLNLEFSKREIIRDEPFNYLQEADQRHTYGPVVLMRALNSSGVLDETTEEGRLFHIRIFLGKKEFFRTSL